MTAIHHPGTPQTELRCTVGYDDRERCSLPPRWVAGAVRSCGCPSSPLRYYCDYHVRMPAFRCFYCGTAGAVTITEPVPLKETR